MKKFSSIPVGGRSMLLATLFALVAACGGGGGGGGGGTTPPPAPPPPTTPPPSGDDARRDVLADIAEQIILPALQDFNTQAMALETAVTALAAAPADAAALADAQAAWDTAMNSWQRNEALQVGPAGKSSNPDAVVAGQDFRDFIYSWPFTLDVCSLEAAALNGDPVSGSTSIDITGLGALEHLLYTATPPAACASQPDAAQRTAHAQRLAARIAVLAISLLNRWDPNEDDFITQWSTAGLSSSVTYAAPQDALDALSIALFYVEKETKDRKVALTTGVGATGLTCGNAASCPELLESRLSRRTGQNLIVNVQLFRDVFTGLNGGMGLNDLLTGISRDDLATAIVDGLDVVLGRLADIEANGGFDAAVEAIADRNECVNAFSSSSGLAPCALLGEMKTALDIFRVDVVAALSLAIPDSSAGDND
ncbi:MAG: imelysin family protein [Pseudomonadota bacterium]